jgi:hypothetical protein
MSVLSKGDEMSNVGSFVAAIAFVFANAWAAFADELVKPDPSTAPTALQIKVSQGDAWAYEIRDDVTGDAKGLITFVATKVTDDGIETLVTYQRTATNALTTSTEVFDARWRMKDNGKVLYQPHLDSTGVPDDLQVGKSWSFKYETSRKAAVLGQEYAGLGKVEAWEHITLPNGSGYDAFKIDVTSSTTLRGSDRKIETHSIMWFAPAVNRLVRRVDEQRENGKLKDASEQTLREYKPVSKT